MDNNNQYDAMSSIKYGTIKKCPNCGEPYRPGMGKCPSCNHLFQNIESNTSAQKLSEGIQRILNEDETLLQVLSDRKREKMERFIADFPIPNSKDDMLEFILCLDSKRKMQDSNHLQKAYGAKYKEIVKKAQIIFPDDKQIEKAIDITSGFSLKILTGEQVAIIGLLSLMILGFLLIFIIEANK